MASRSSLQLSGKTGIAVVVVVVFVALVLVAAPAPGAPQPGSRVCGWMVRIAPDSSHPDVVAQFVAFSIEVDKDSGRDICDKATKEMKDGIKSDPANEFGFDDDHARRQPVNTWGRFEMMECEDIGIYFKNSTQYPSTDYCDEMNKSSMASGDQHVYQTTKVLNPPTVVSFPAEVYEGDVTYKQQPKNVKWPW